ncbi:hypothetical protein BDM02DRAFT_3223456 [Thelephora ganbajun]|uniref:Uncharacterized protein n=1 Tax=Thelephora ganbajun TaxID=370292 RepID=A0ACB6Z206_THEGA|nr:hypothetical protein BDM02DRAFT_3223456 [Thelephora ganbajun]
MAGTGRLCGGRAAANTTHPANSPPATSGLDQALSSNSCPSSRTTWSATAWSTSTTASVVWPNSRKWAVPDEDVVPPLKQPKTLKKNVETVHNTPLILHAAPTHMSNAAPAVYFPPGPPHTLPVHSNVHTKPSRPIIPLDTRPLQHWMYPPQWTFTNPTSDSTTPSVPPVNRPHLPQYKPVTVISAEDFSDGEAEVEPIEDFSEEADKPAAVQFLPPQNAIKSAQSHQGRFRSAIMQVVHETKELGLSQKASALNIADQVEMLLQGGRFLDAPYVGNERPPNTMYKSPILKKAIEMLYTTFPWRTAVKLPWFRGATDRGYATCPPISFVAFAASAYRNVLDSLISGTEEIVLFSEVGYCQVYNDLYQLIEDNSAYPIFGETVRNNLQSLIANIMFDGMGSTTFIWSPLVLVLTIASPIPDFLPLPPPTAVTPPQFYR